MSPKICGEERKSKYDKKEDEEDDDDDDDNRNDGNEAREEKIREQVDRVTARACVDSDTYVVVAYTNPVLLTITRYW
jgi:hypothetical protein